MTLMEKETIDCLKKLNTCQKCRKMVWNCECEEGPTHYNS